MDVRYKKLREKLHELGYKQPIVPEVVPLVEKLVSDLIKTTSSLQKYVNIAKVAFQERDELQIGLEPYKCDNAKLVQECNKLHLSLLQNKENYEKQIRALKKEILKLEQEKIILHNNSEKFKKHCCELEDKLHRRFAKTTASKQKTFESTTSQCNRKLEEVIKMCDDRVRCLLEEINQLKEERLEYTEMIECYRHQVKCREKEIERLQCMLSGGRPTDALVKDCCYKEVEAKLQTLQQELYQLKKEKLELEDHLRESVIKQHEAMKRALCLVDRNKQLEKELGDIDEMALTVEAECNSTVKNSVQKINRLQEKMHEISCRNQQFERELCDLSREKQQLREEMEALQNEKKSLQRALESAMQEKESLAQKMLNFERGEQDLNFEVDRLTQISQKRRTNDYDDSNGRRTSQSTQDAFEHNQLKRKLEEKDAEIAKLKKQNETCMHQMQELRHKSDLDFDAQSTKSNMKKIEREKDTLMNEVKRLEQEKLCLENRLREICEKQRDMEFCLRQELCTAEETIKKLEDERVEILSTESVRRSTIHSLEQQVKELTEELHECRAEANEHKTMYHHVKNLHEEADQSRNEAHEKIAQLHSQLQDAQEKHRMLEGHKMTIGDELNSLRNEVQSARQNLEIMDKEKDELLMKLDAKTEMCKMLEEEVISKSEHIQCLEEKCCELEKKMSAIYDDQACREYQFRAVCREVENLKKDLAEVCKEKECALKENLRLHSEIAAARADCKKHSSEMEHAHRQIEELKLQLQEYVKEVKKCEDTLARKEYERNELLEQFKNLTRETSMLESNNYSLEETANHSKIQLSATLDHVSTLEKKLEDHATTIGHYDKQIKDLSQQVVNLEMMVKELRRERDCLKCELEKCRECVAQLNRQREEALNQLSSKRNEQNQMCQELGKLRDESSMLHKRVEREQTSCDRVERLLSENRKEAVELKLVNQELLTEVERLKKTVDELQAKISRREVEHFYYEDRISEGS